MSSQGPYALVAVVQTLLRAGISLGIPRSELLTAASLTEDTLADPDTHIPYAHQAGLGREIVSRNRGVNIELVALEQLSLSSMGLLGHALRHCATYEAMVRVFCRYQNVLTNVARWSFDETTGVVRVDTTMVGPAPLTMLLALVKLGRLLTHVDFVPVRVEAKHPPLGDPREFERVLALTPQFRAEGYVMELDPATLSLPVLEARPELLAGCTPLLGAYATAAEEPPLSRRLRTYFERHLPEGQTSRSWYARSLGMSDRTLNRRLEAENTTFRKELERARQQLAERWLEHADHSVAEIALMVGYSEPSAFHRSFRRWHDCSPRAWRQRTFRA
ncbi:HTH-type transcriptional regulator VirS [Enhygromyxa salina]|uniref:HTH-type transcriptional regulator VirS n=1 Tax=Enhygromyxa salina TaxID=215803 RepID=A0A2S9YJZ0_9BACT|nr:AraC family transcriptional regulator [Enhygromyxa salina]PRQ05418.1 HTH-type transcriptional regulator VirS [Enhygromyxa salina]